MQSVEHTIETAISMDAAEQKIARKAAQKLRDIHAQLQEKLTKYTINSMKG